LIQTEAEAANEVNHIDLPIPPDDCLEYDSTLISGSPGFLGVLGFDTINHCRRTDVAADGEGAITTATVFARTGARSFAFTDASALTASLTRRET